MPLTSVQHRFFRITVTCAVQRAGLATVLPAFNNKSGYQIVNVFVHLQTSGGEPDNRSPADVAEGWAAWYRFLLQVKILADFAHVGAL